MDKVAFLINPAAGTSGTKKQATEMVKFLKKNHPKTLFETETAADMREVAQTLAEKNYKAIFACGGDGTLNLVSKELVGTDTAMAMIPLGSGNGFARHHHIPLKWDKAMAIVEHHKTSVRDTGLINGIHFLNIAGVGFAAKISHAFKGEKKRGLTGYAKTVMKNLKMEPFHATLTNENSTWEGDTWMVDFCNGSQWGNNFRVEAGARDDDGALNAVVFKKMSPVKIPALGFRFAANTVAESPDVQSFAGAAFHLEFEGKKPLHVDGEPIAFIENIADVSVVPKSLKIWTF
jgi:diacylglycerol kinase (ATP)